MLGSLLFFGMLGIAGIKEIKDNYEIKKLSSEYDKNGNLHYIDNQCRDYMNGERVQQIVKEDANGIPLYSTVGMSSSKVYETSYGRGTQQLMAYYEKGKQEDIERGLLGYMQFNPYFGRAVLTELSTNRTITCLFEWEPSHGKNIYRKWYFRPECQGKYDYNKTVDGDYGIEITKEEYEKLNQVLCHTARNIPSDMKVYYDLIGRG